MATSESMMQAELLRLVTAGSVDDGKSTLLGRLLYDTKQILADQLEHIEETSLRRGDGYVNLALLTDGLRAEREQGITIDVAYRSFVTAAPPLPARRRARPRPVHAEHGHRRLDRRRRRDPARRAQGRRRADAPPLLHRRDPRRSRTSWSPSTRWTSSTSRPSASPRSRPTCRRSPTRLGLHDARAIPMSALRGRQRRRARRRDALVRRPDAARASRDDRDRRRPQPRGPALPGAVGDPADVRRAPRLPRLRRRGRRRHLAGRRRGRRAAVGPAHARRGGRDLRGPARGGDPAAVGDDPARGRRRRRPRRHARRPRARRRSSPAS